MGFTPAPIAPIGAGACGGAGTSTITIRIEIKRAAARKQEGASAGDVVHQAELPSAVDGIQRGGRRGGGADDTVERHSGAVGRRVADRAAPEVDDCGQVTTDDAEG